MEPFIGQIMGFGGNYAPRGWAFCNGQLMAISSNTALFSILGTTYGGDGRTTFALPDLQGRAPIHWGNGPGLSPVFLGERAGTETVTLTQANLPPHNHTATLHAETVIANQSNPNNRMLALGEFYADLDPVEDRTMAPESITVGTTGGGTSFGIRSPYLAISMIIALQGIFPPHN